MNKLERELKLLFGESELFSEVVFCGKTMIGKLDKDVRAKIEFISTSVHKHYDSLKVTVLNRTEGVIDTTVFNFSDMIGLKNGRIPYYWDEPNCNGWYGFKMTSDDYDQISDKVHDYMSMFAEEDIGYEMRTY
jgi:hypothetical protein